MDRQPPVPVVGLIGGIAAGKSAVANLLENKGAQRIDADRIGHDVLRRIEISNELARMFGTDILDPSGHIRRGALGKLVFGSDPAKVANRRRLEALVHPLIREEVTRQIERNCALPDPPPAIVLDAPLLVEAGWVELCNEVLFVDASDQTRITRAAQRGWTEDEFRQRERSQFPIEQKLASATTVVHNDSTLESLAEQIETIWMRIVSARG